MPNKDTDKIQFSDKDFVVFGMQVYGGRIPAMAAGLLENFKSEKTMAAVVVVYGNRAYEDEVITDKDKCILCCACVKICPTEARGLEVPPLLGKIKLLSENCEEPRKRELFI